MYKDYIEDLFEEWLGDIKYSKGVVSFKVEEGEFCSVQEIIDFQQLIRRIPVTDYVIEYAVKLVSNSHQIYCFHLAVGTSPYFIS